MLFKVALHPSREELGLDLVVWMEAAMQKKKEKSLRSGAEVYHSMRLQHPSSLAPSLPADWVWIIDPIVWAPAHYWGKCRPGLWSYEGVCERPLSERLAWFPLYLWPHTGPSSLMACGVIGHPASPTFQPCPLHQAGEQVWAATHLLPERSFLRILKNSLVNLRSFGQDYQKVQG